MLDTSNELLTVAEAANVAGLSHDDMQALFDSGALPILTPSPSRRLVRRADLHAYLETCPPTTPQPELLTVTEAAQLTGITPRTVRQLFDERAFPLVRIGRRLYVRQADLRAFLDANTIPARGQR